MYNQSHSGQETVTIASAAATATVSDPVTIIGCNRLYVHFSTFASACPIVLKGSTTATTSVQYTLHRIEKTATAQASEITIASSDHDGHLYDITDAVVGLKTVAFAPASMAANGTTVTVYKCW